MEYNPNTKTMESSKKNLGVTEEIIWNKLVQINKQFHDLEKEGNEHIDSSDVELGMSEMIMEKTSDTTSLELIGDEMIWELRDILKYISHTGVDEIPTLKKFNKIFDNLTEKEWNFYIDCILNY
jgi:hypothetical protein